MKKQSNQACLNSKVKQYQLSSKKHKSIQQLGSQIQEGEITVLPVPKHNLVLESYPNGLNKMPSQVFQNVPTLTEDSIMALDAELFESAKEATKQSIFDVSQLQTSGSDADLWQMDISPSFPELGQLAKNLSFSMQHDHE